MPSKINKAYLFLNGEAPKNLPVFDEKYLIACTDGAIHYLLRLGLDIEKLDFISGDFDSISGNDRHFIERKIPKNKIIFTLDQNKTDFQKALEILSERGVNEVTVFGGSGAEMDHFLGNLTVLLQFQNRMSIKMYDDFSVYYFVPNQYELNQVKGKMISLYPFPTALGVKTQGLNWNLYEEDLCTTGKISTRNFAAEDCVNIQFQSGNLLVFISHNPY